MSEAAEWLSEISWTPEGLLPVIAQDYRTGRVLMMAWMNAEALQLTVDSGYAVYWSRSRQSLWKKGEQSGNQQRILDICLDCDGDTLLIKVEQQGGIACHTGRQSCLFRTLNDQGQWQVTDPVLKSPEELYGKVDE
ncbi:MAG: phosphoribosyl-AMP cyclohydrolase [Gammaproteobacteria bacterium]